jgi:hypothetical protein
VRVGLDSIARTLGRTNDSDRAGLGLKRRKIQHVTARNMQVSRCRRAITDNGRSLAHVRLCNQGEGA